MEKMKRLEVLWPWLLCLALWLLAIVAFASCTAGKAVVVPEVRQTVVHERDTVWRTDSVVRSSTTIIQQADSALMAEFGIRLKSMEKAWLVRQSTDKESSGSVTFISRRDSVVHDSIPVPYPKTEYKEKPLTRWQGFVMCAGYGMVAVLGIVIVLAMASVIMKLKR